MPEPAPERTPPDDTTPVAEGSYEWYRRELERLRAELANRDSLLEKYRETVGVVVGQREEAKAELATARKAIDGLMDDGDVNDLMRPVEAERDGLRHEVEQWQATYGETALRDARKILAERDALNAAINARTDAGHRAAVPAASSA